MAFCTACMKLCFRTMALFHIIRQTSAWESIWDKIILQGCLHKTKPSELLRIAPTQRLVAKCQTSSFSKGWIIFKKSDYH